MITETSFITTMSHKITLLKHEAIDRLVSVVDDLPKYKKPLENLIINFTVEDMLCLMNTIYRDNEFKQSVYYIIYNQYFDEIEEFTHALLLKVPQKAV
jgi:hypothetical protein